MSKINLLPWREEAKKFQNKIFVGLLLAAIFSAIIITVFVHMVIAYKIANEQKNITYLELEKTELKEKVIELLKLQETKKLLLNQMRVIQILQGDRISIAKLLDILARYTTEGIFFTELTRKEVVVLPKETDVSKINKQNQVEVVGIAQSNASITELLKNLEHEQWFTDVQLSEVFRDKNGRDLNFKINLLHKIAEVQ